MTVIYRLLVKVNIDQEAGIYIKIYFEEDSSICSLSR